MKPNDSGITTSQKAQPSKIGTQVGEPGSAMPGNLRHLAERLAARRPSEVDRRLVSSALQCGVVLRESYEPRYQSMVMRAEGGSLADVDASRRQFGHAMAPPTIKQMEDWIVELSVITARRQDDQATEALRLRAYSSRLVEYPADVARHALLGKRWHFFPTWDELGKECDALLAQRRRMIRALDEEAERLHEAEIRARALPTEKTAAKTPEEIAAANAEIDALISGLRGNASEESASETAINDTIQQTLRAYRQRATGDAEGDAQ